MKYIVIAIAFLITVSGCINHKSTAEQKSFPATLEEVYQEAHKTPNLRSLLISQNNQLIAEQYFDAFDRDSLDHVRSVTKSVMATLIGIAIDKGYILGVDDSIGKYLKVPAEKQQITIRHLLTMTSGISWNEGANAEGYGAWSSSQNELQYVLDKPMEVTPGTKWNYNSGAIHILSAVLTKATEMNTLDFARKYLFRPLGIKKVRWEKQSDGYYNGAAGLELKPRDMIKFGQLYANGGTFNGHRILSQQFIQEAISHQQPKDMELEEGSGYGYCWWLGEEDGLKAYVAMGYGGQLILVSGNENIVISMTHNWRRMNGATAGKQSQRGLNVLALEVLKVLE